MSKVAIITRTKNRPLLLPRVREGLEQQTYRDFIWVIVNDAGEKGYVDEEATMAKQNGLAVLVVHRERSVGMEAASNDGVRKSQSEYVVIHDDDDTWQREFLEKTVQFLDEKRNYAGVVTHSLKITEDISGDVVTHLYSCPYNDWLQSIHISEILEQNRFAPISFLFRRSIYDAVGGFDESLPVLGDWDFNLKVLMKEDIGVIPESLANYHFRENTNSTNSVYGNTVTGGIDRHIEYEAIYRNRKFREDVEAHRIGLGFALALGRMQMSTVGRLDRIGATFTILKKFAQKLRIDKLLRRVAGV